MIAGQEQQELVKLMTQLYREILDIETRFRLEVGGGDFRPRIEYFHDAIRAFTKGDLKAFDKGERLSVEYLAYDLSMLRYLQSKPLANIRPPAGLSVHTEVTRRDSRLPLSISKVDRETRETLSQAYQSYAVMFAALMKPFADRNYHARVEDAHAQVEELAQMKHAVEDKDLRQLEDAAQQVDSASLRQAIHEFVSARGGSKQNKLESLLAGLKNAMEGADKEIAGIEAAHLDYVMAQLGIFEDGKDLVKKLMKRGMNVVGKFVDSAMQQAQKESGKGR